MTASGRLAGQVVLVTGAGSGLGRAIVDRFVAEGARVVAFDRSESKLAAVAEAHGEAVRTVAGDVRSAADNRRACSTAVDGYGRLDTFVGNAGLWDFGRPLAESSLEDLDRGFDELFGVNVKGYLIGVAACREALVASHGSVVLTLSNAAFFAAGGGVLYTASKHAGLGLVRQLAYELAPQVRVNAVAPGGMDTDLRGPAALGLADTAIGSLSVGAYMEKNSALHFAPAPADYVGSYVLLAASRESPTVTGSVFDLSSVGTPVRPGGEGEA